ncbi:hypothetical protein WJX73_002066 [Symbiochloris irregularis]|uniref:Uncharacterized protein n=1 Tax=Symbiochloris irregularis TaxID=706552 RepID=A0AAW1P2C1_9CHLO
MFCCCIAGRTPSFALDPHSLRVLRIVSWWVQSDPRRCKKEESQQLFKKFTQMNPAHATIAHFTACHESAPINLCIDKW